MESKFIALVTASKEAKCLRNVIWDIELWPQPIPTISLQCNSEAIMSRTCNKIYNGKSRHISLRHKYIRQLISDGIITVVYVRSSSNLAKLLIKGPLRDMIKRTAKAKKIL